MTMNAMTVKRANRQPLHEAGSWSGLATEDPT
jgi:hypothetical protein